MIGEFNNVKIQGISVAVPSIVEDNKTYTSILGERRTKKQRDYPKVCVNLQTDVR